MNQKVLKKISIFALLTIMLIALVGCNTNFKIYGNLAMKASVGFVSGTQSDGLNLIDGREDTVWKGDASGNKTCEVILNFSEEITFNKFLIDEEGNSITNFVIQIPKGKKAEDWLTIYSDSDVNNGGIIRFDEVSATQLKLKIIDSNGKFGIIDIGIYYEKLSEEETDRQD